MLDSISQYSPVVIINGLAAILFMIGYVLFGIAMIRIGDAASLVRCSGRCGSSGPFDWFRRISARLHGRMVHCDLGQCESRRRSRLVRVSAVAWTGSTGCASFRGVDTSMSTRSSKTPATNLRGTGHRVRVIIFRVVATLAGLFFVVAVVLMASAPWVLLQPDQDVNTELNRWFLTVAGSVDAITAGVLLVLALQPRRTLLVVELAGAVVVAGAIILPFQPSFAAILAVGVIPLIAYPYWRDVRMFPSWWAGVSRPILVLAVLAAS